MSYQEKRALVSLFTSIIVTLVYAAVMLQRYPQADAYSPDVFRFWGAFCVILIPVSIIARIVIQVFFSIINTITTGEEEPSVVDERDRIVELKAARNALYIFTCGFMLAMAALLFDLPPAVMFVLLIGAGVIADAASELATFYFYRRGV